MAASFERFPHEAFPQAPIRQASLAYVTHCLAIGQCCALVGISNTGKSTLLRSLQTAEARRRSTQPGRQPPYIIFVDALDGAVATEQSFYELLLRRLIDSALQYGASDEQVAQALQLHAIVLDGVSPLACRAYFAQAVRGLTHNAPYDIVIVLDNLDDLFCELPPWPFRHLRALRDACGSRLCFVTATTHTLDELRSDEEAYEFIELFQVYTHHLPLLSASESEIMLDYLARTAACQLRPKARDLAIVLAGGHPGLLDRTVRTLASFPAPEDLTEQRAIYTLLAQSHIKAECARIWHGLSREEQDALQSHLLSSVRTNAEAQAMLARRGLLRHRAQGYEMASPVLDSFIRQYLATETPQSGLHCDLETGQIWLHGREITLQLSEAQRRLLRHLYRNQGQVCRQDDIIATVWETTEGVSPGALYELVKRVRQKVESDWHNPRMLVTVVGEGYRLKVGP